MNDINPTSYFYWLIHTKLDDRFIELPDRKMHVCPPIICKDGAYVSVQASYGHYCQPRDDIGPWTEMECGYPSVTPPLSWKPYAEQWHRGKDDAWNWIKYNFERYEYYKKGQITIKEYTKPLWRAIKEYIRAVFKKPGKDTVYGYVPINIIKEYIDKHGGEDTPKCWENVNEWIQMQRRNYASRQANN